MSVFGFALGKLGFHNPALNNQVGQSFSAGAKQRHGMRHVVSDRKFTFRKSAILAILLNFLQTREVQMQIANCTYTCHSLHGMSEKPHKCSAWHVIWTKILYPQSGGYHLRCYCNLALISSSEENQETDPVSIWTIFLWLFSVPLHCDLFGVRFIFLSSRHNRRRRRLHFLLDCLLSCLVICSFRCW